MKGREGGKGGGKRGRGGILEKGDVLKGGKTFGGLQRH